MAAGQTAQAISTATITSRSTSAATATSRGPQMDANERLASGWSSSSAPRASARPAASALRPPSSTVLRLTGAAAARFGAAGADPASGASFSAAADPASGAS